MSRKYSKSAIDRAGDFFRDPKLYQDEWLARFDEPYGILAHWRSLHALPLVVITTTLRYRASRVSENTIVAQRLKRFASVSSKLVKTPGMALTRMQDIAGCRAVVSTVDEVYRLKDLYENRAARQRPGSPELISVRDYILQPKSSGYRSLHLVMKYRAAKDQYSDCDGLRVEIQIRSKLQHVWAMAVETADSLTGQALKAGTGRPEWHMFFRLMSTAIALKENLPIVDGTDENEVYWRIKKLVTELKIIALFEGMGGAVEQLPAEEFRAKHRQDMYLLTFDARAQRTDYAIYSRDEFAEAAAAYASGERRYVNDPDVHIVLVEAGSMRDLRAAYPSYFSDATQFIELVRDCCDLGTRARSPRAADRVSFPQYDEDDGIYEDVPQ